MKKITILLTAMLITVSLTACNQQSEDTTSSVPESSIQTSAESKEESEQSNEPITVSDVSSEKPSADESSDDVFVPPIPTTITDYQYIVLNDKCRLVRYTGTETRVVVPDRVTVDGKEYEVEISAGCFKDTSIVTLALPDNITEIPDSMCENCKSLTSVSFTNVRSIGKNAFWHCENWKSRLDELNFGNQDMLKKIEERAFGYSGLYGKIIIKPDMELGNGAFQVCKEITEVEIQSGVTVIPERLFSDNCSLKIISLPETLTEIKDMAFNQTIADTLTIPKSVKKIGTLMISTYMAPEWKYTGSILGYKGSAAEEYANKNGIVFSPLD